MSVRALLRVARVVAGQQWQNAANLQINAVTKLKQLVGGPGEHAALRRLGCRNQPSSASAIFIAGRWQI